MSDLAGSRQMSSYRISASATNILMRFLHTDICPPMPTAFAFVTLGFPDMNSTAGACLPSDVRDIEQLPQDRSGFLE